MHSYSEPKGPMRLSSVINHWSAPYENDVKKVKDALVGTGHYKLPESGLNGNKEPQLIASIKNFQSDNDLRVDGHIAPGGETETAMAKSRRYKYSKCPAIHGGVYSPKLCFNCFLKA